MKRSPLKTYARIERRTPLRSTRKPFPSKGDPGTATAASGAVPVSLEAPKFPKPSRARHPRGAKPKFEVNHGSRKARAVAAPGTDTQPLVALEGQHVPLLIGFPKPARRGKSAPAPTKRRPMRKSARGTKHSRRQREFGRMAFYSSLWCMLRDISRGGRVPPDLNEVTQACGGPIEVAHLGDRGATGTGGWRRAPDAKTAPLCRHHHRGIDGRVGGKAPWYVALGREGQRELRADLVLFAGYYWDGLTPDQRAEWDRVATERFASRRAA